MRQRTEGIDVPHRAELSKEIEQFLWSDVEAGGGLALGQVRSRACTDLKFFTKRALWREDTLAEVV